MTITNSSSARRAGFKYSNKAFKKAAGIAMTKIGTRTLSVPLPAAAFHGAGASVALAIDGDFLVMNLPDANTGDLYTTLQLPAEYIAASVTVDIYWKTASLTTTNAVKFSVELGSNVAGEASTLDDTQVVTQAPAAVANKVRKCTVTFAAALFTAGDIVGIHIQRNPADGADTLATDVKFIGAVLNFTGRG